MRLYHFGMRQFSTLRWFGLLRGFGINTGPGPVPGPGLPESAYLVAFSEERSVLPTLIFRRSVVPLFNGGRRGMVSSSHSFVITAYTPARSMWPS